MRAQFILLPAFNYGVESPGGTDVTRKTLTNEVKMRLLQANKRPQWVETIDREMARHALYTFFLNSAPPHAADIIQSFSTLHAPLTEIILTEGA